ncbi:MAG: hypothetical protein JXR69_01030 [Candidatus Delongbacteria bacterium]|nr:hypothetical protein [Candidatus Delongbacteria bacterium]
MKSSWKKYLDIFVVIVALIALLLTAPFTYFQIFDEQILINPNLKNFLYLKSLYFFVVIIVSLVVYFRFNRKRFLERSSFFIWLYSFFYLLSRVQYSLDVTDQGYHLSKAWALVNGDIANNIDMIWLTSFISGLWMKIIGHPSILWARVGYSIVVSLIIYFSVKTVMLYCEINFRKLVFIVITSVFFINFNYYLTVNYDNFPTMILIGSLYLILKDLRFSSISKKHLILAGSFIGLAIFAKISMILTLILPLVLYYESDQPKKRKLKSLKYIYSSVLCVMIAGFLLLSLLSQSTNYLKTFSHAALEKNTEMNFEPKNDIFDVFLTDSMRSEPIRKNEQYYKNSPDISGVGYLMKIYSEHFWNIIKVSLIIGVILLILYQITTVIRSPWLKLIFILLTSYVMILNNITSILIYCDFMIALAFAVISYSLFTTKKIDNQKKLLLIGSVLVLILSFAGSNLSFNTSLRSGGAMLFFLNVIVFEGRSEKNRSKNLSITSSQVSILLLAFVMIISLMKLVILEVHRDSEKKYLTTMFKSNNLFGIFSTSQRVEAVDGLVKFLSGYELINNKAIFVNHIPMLYYILDKEFALNTPWIEIEDFVKFFEISENFKNENFPSLVIIAKKSGRSEYWPTVKKGDSTEIFHLKWIDYFSYFVKKNDYKLKYENDMFKVFIHG